MERYCLSQECLSFSLSLQAESKERRLQNSGLSSGRYEDNLGFACKCLDIESGLSSFYVKRYNKIVEFGYNSKNMATDISSAPLSLLYNYSPGGNITRITDNSGTSPIVLNYTYDARGQLKSAQANGPDGIYTISYGYDGTSNRVSEIYRNSENQVVSQKGYVYTAGDYLVSTSDSSSTVSYVWDIYGQLSSKSSGEEYIFSGKRNLNSVAASNTVQEIYTYDALGRRLKVENADITTLNFPLGNDTSYEIKTEGSDVTKTRYISANGKYLAKTVKVNDEPESKYFHHIDLVGSIRAITDISGTVVSSYEYEPFGVVTLSSGTDEDNLGFAGKRLDIGSGLSYFGARYYDSDMGRFISRDPAQDGRNWFVYCANNPLLYVDPNGLAVSKDEWLKDPLGDGGIGADQYWEDLDLGPMVLQNEDSDFANILLNVFKLSHPGQVHNKVVEHIVDNNSGFVANQYVKYPNGKRGFADLLNTTTGEVWEVKRNTIKLEVAINQLKKYVNNGLKNYPDLTFSSGKIIKSGSDSFPTALGTIHYWYWDAAEGYSAKNYPAKGTSGQGIIYYDYEYKPDPKKVLVPASAIALFAITGGIVNGLGPILIPAF